MQLEHRVGEVCYFKPVYIRGWYKEPEKITGSFNHGGGCCDVDKICAVCPRARRRAGRRAMKAAYPAVMRWRFAPGTGCALLPCACPWAFSPARVPPPNSNLSCFNPTRQGRASRANTPVCAFPGGLGLPSDFAVFAAGAHSGRKFLSRLTRAVTKAPKPMSRRIIPANPSCGCWAPASLPHGTSAGRQRRKFWRFSSADTIVRRSPGWQGMSHS